jgi:hypothetical protein
MVSLKTEDLMSQIALQDRLLRKIQVFRPFQIHIYDIHLVTGTVKEVILLIEDTVSLRTVLCTDRQKDE